MALADRVSYEREMALYRPCPLNGASTVRGHENEDGLEDGWMVGYLVQT